MDEEYVVCPFNKSHVISRLRIQYHLVKCKKNYPFTKKLICPYDATEYIDPIDYTAHLCQCKKKRRLDVSEEFRRKQYESIPHGDISVQTFYMPDVQVTDEWDDGSNDEQDNRLTQDEIKVIRLKNQTTRALQKACTFLPVVSHPIGRGKGDLYQNYVNHVAHTPENSSFSQSVTFFSCSDKKSSVADGNEVINGNVKEKRHSNGCELTVDEEAGIYDDADEEAGIYDDAERKETPKATYVNEVINFHVKKEIKPDGCERNVDEEGIYDDADEEEKKEEPKSFKESIVSSSVSGGSEERNYCDKLKYFRPSMGRGVNKYLIEKGVSMPLGRGLALNRSLALSADSSQPRTLDCILKELIQNKMTDDDNLFRASGLKDDKDVPSVSCLDETASYKDHSAKEESELEKLDYNSVGTSNTLLNSQQMCKGNSLDNLLNDLVKNLSSLSSKDKDYSHKLESPLNRSDNFEKTNNFRPMGRARIWQDLE